MVVRRLKKYLEINNIISKHQAAFRKHFSTMDSLTRIEKSIRETFLNKEYMIALFLDVEKAYDNVWHYGLM